jgi:hypothetical protein
MQKAIKSIDQNVLQKLKVLPENQKEEVLDFMEFLVSKKKGRKIPPWGASRHRGKFKFDWEGGLTDIKIKYSSVDLQHKAMEWR